MVETGYEPEHIPIFCGEKTFHKRKLGFRQRLELGDFLSGADKIFELINTYLPSSERLWIEGSPEIKINGATISLERARGASNSGAVDYSALWKFGTPLMRGRIESWAPVDPIIQAEAKRNIGLSALLGVGSVAAGVILPSLGIYDGVACFSGLVPSVIGMAHGANEQRMNQTNSGLTLSFSPQRGEYSFEEGQNYIGLSCALREFKL